MTPMNYEDIASKTLGSPLDAMRNRICYHIAWNLEWGPVAESSTGPLPTSPLPGPGRVPNHGPTFRLWCAGSERTFGNWFPHPHGARNVPES